MSTFDEHKNLNGPEQALSIAAGLACIGLGLSRGGVLGVLKAGFGSQLVWRGLSGHCSMKGLMRDPAGELRYWRDELQRARETLASLADRHGIRLAEPAPEGVEEVGAPVTAVPDRDVFAQVNADAFDTPPKKPA